MKFKTLFLGLIISLTMHAQTDSTQVLEGKLNRTQLEHFSWFKKGYETYKPSTTILESLVKMKSCSLVIVLGTWCSDSHELIPQLFKVMDMVGIDKFEIIGVDRKKKCSSVDITPLNIEYVPVILVFQQKKYKGRIVETTKESIEADLLAILK
ncbi:MAG: hypothetical protein MUC81_10630 [Bacteroidia bacterium]|jgi:thiol-disulfide isomerase/thioredoxin|nr:hypothetical protein [Bacteroidia bacterium]